MITKGVLYLQPYLVYNFPKIPQKKNGDYNKYKTHSSQTFQPGIVPVCTQPLGYTEVRHLSPFLQLKK